MQTAVDDVVIHRVLVASYLRGSGYPPHVERADGRGIILGLRVKLRGRICDLRDARKDAVRVSLYNLHQD